MEKSLTADLWSGQNGVDIMTHFNYVYTNNDIRCQRCTRKYVLYLHLPVVGGLVQRCLPVFILDAHVNPSRRQHPHILYLPGGGS